MVSLEHDLIEFVGSASAPNTCGELIQGSLNGTDFLVTCPIDVFSKARVFISRFEGEIQVVRVPQRFSMQQGSWSMSGDRTMAFSRTQEWNGVGPAGALEPFVGSNGHDAGIVHKEDKAACSWGSKVRRALELTLGYLGIPGRQTYVFISNPMCPGKGLGTSTADIAAAVAAVGQAVGVEMPPEIIARIALQVEPSDGSMFRGVVMFGHRGAGLIQAFGNPPPMQIVLVDTGGFVDTVEFNTRTDLAQLNQIKESKIRDALCALKEGFERRDPSLIGAAATESALAHQIILFKRGLEQLVQKVLFFGGYGVVIAHSGTVAGVLVRPNLDGNDVTKILDAIVESRIGTVLGFVNLTGGGVRLGR